VIITSAPLPIRAHPKKAGVALDIHADLRQGMRPTQEDGCLIRRRLGFILVAIADGVGGHPAGDQAARIALETLDEAFPEEDAAISPWAAGERLAAAFELAHQRVRDFGTLLGAEKRPCTTLTAALILPRLGVFAFASAGDSHLYVTGPRRPITRLNLLQEDERGRLTSCVGGGKLIVNGSGELHLLRPGETLLFATDGLDIVPLAQVETLLQGADTAAQGVRRLLRQVEDRNHPKQDNTCLVTVRLSAFAAGPGRAGDRGADELLAGGATLAR
jgi:serine/threonine protein phosphatase PrpC